MPKSLNFSGDDVINKLSKLGFSRVRQRGSHVVLKKHTDNGDIGCVVPLHKEIAKGTLHSILKQAKITWEEFINM